MRNWLTVKLDLAEADPSTVGLVFAVIEKLGAGQKVDSI
jgi:hypothetical protein